MSEPQLITVLALCGGALSLDVTAALQVMISQPIAAGGIAGLLVGDPVLGLVIGGALQLLWTGVLPVGAAAFPDGAVSGVVGVGVAALLERSGVPVGLSLALGFGGGLIAGVLSQPLTLAVRRQNVRFADAAIRRGGAGDAGGVRTAVLGALAIRLVTSAALTAALLTVSLLLRPLAAVGWSGSYPVLLWAAPIAAGVALASGRWRVETAFLAAGFAAGFVFIVLV
jgi:mannose/fructose/N-acetylgalactosamine-specific phosphotransferase system component IIC